MRKTSVYALLLLAITFAAFAPSLKNGLVNWDDPKYVTETAQIYDMSLKGVKNIFTSFCYANYHPLTILSFRAEYSFFKADPRIYHATNLLLHLFNCLLVFWLIFILSGKFLPSFLTAVFFGVHPLNVEAVAWISGRKDLLCAFFFIGAIVSYMHYLKNRTARQSGSAGFYFLSLLAFILSLMSKATAVTLPFVLVLLDKFTGRKPDRSSMADKVPYLALAMLFAAMAVIAQGSSGTINITPLLKFPDSLIIAAHGLVFYPAKILAPFNLSAVYHYPPVPGHFPLEFLLSPAIAAMFAAAIFFSARYTKKIIFGSLFFLLTVLPVLQILPVGQAVAADRYAYIPSIGLFYIAGESFHWLYERFKGSAVPRNLVLLFVIGIIVSLAAVTRQRCLIWRDSVTLWQDVLKNYPDSRLAHNNLAEAFMEKKNYEKAIHHYERLLPLDPGNRNAYYSLGTIYARTGRMQEALITFKKALEIKPDSADALNNLGNVYAILGRKDKALSLFNKALAADPNYVPAYNNLGDFYMKKGDYKKALGFIRKALEIDPRSGKALKRLDMIQQRS